jgi:RNA polymerase sigma factor (sigma-70 family)
MLDALTEEVEEALRQHIRGAALRMRWRKGTLSLYAWDGRDENAFGPETRLIDGRAEDDLTSFELNDAIESRLGHDDVIIARALARGMTQSEIAARLGVSQQAVCKRVKSIRERLRDVFGRKG